MMGCLGVWMVVVFFCVGCVCVDVSVLKLKVIRVVKSICKIFVMEDCCFLNLIKRID